MTAKASGFNPIGIPVRRLIEQSGITASFVYFGTIYGPGGVFGDAIFPALASGKWKNFGVGADRMILTHVDDAARGLVRIAGFGAPQIAGKTYVITDADPVDMEAFFGLAAHLMGVAKPGRVPKWMASLVAGHSLIEATLRATPFRPAYLDSPDFDLIYPSYRQGLPLALQALGLRRVVSEPKIHGAPTVAQGI